jgi:hypothetical protein
MYDAVNKFLVRQSTIFGRLGYLLSVSEVRIGIGFKNNHFIVACKSKIDSAIVS